MEITVRDDFFPVDLLNKLLKESDEYSWMFRRGDGNQDIYWTKFVYGSMFDRKTDKFIPEFTEPTIKEAWNYFANKYNLNDSHLLSVYLNGLTNGIEAHQHIDADNQNEMTVICYLCENWNSHWSGETSFYSGIFSRDPTNPVFYTHEVEKTVLPRYNRIVIFNSSIIHGVHPISKTYKGLRKTLMFKIKGNYKDINHG